jgi:hypothetical protein
MPAMNSTNKLLLAFTPYAIWSPHFETELEIIQNHLDAGGQALVLGCKGELPICEPNPSHDLIICAKCKSRFKSGMRWLSRDRLLHKTFFNITPEQARIIKDLEENIWDSQESLKSFKVDGVDIGMAALSSIITFLREPKPKVSEHQELIRKHVSSALIVYFSIKNNFLTANPQSLLVCNGRFSSFRPALRAAQKFGVTVYVDEVASEPNRYNTVKNTYPHDIKYLKSEIESIYSSCTFSFEKKSSMGLSWYADRRAGKNQVRYHYSRSQQEDLLPKFLDDKKIKIVIFNSSEDEFVAIEEWQNPFYRDQSDAISRLAFDLKGDPRFQIFLRVHPNLNNVHNSQTTEIRDFELLFPNVCVIPPDSPVSSYALLDRADVVVSYGSTIGIEAAYAGTPSILMARAVYEDLGTCICPRSHEELIALLIGVAEGKALEVPSNYLIGVIKYGLFNRLWGQPFKFVRPFDAFSAKMEKNGKLVSIRSSIAPNIASVLKRFCSQLLGIKKN